MFAIVDKIDKAMETQKKCTLIDKMGRHLHGTVLDTWVMHSGGKLRGKVKFRSEEMGDVEVDANDVLDLIVPK